MEIIKITEQNGKQAVSARELHQFLIVEAKGGQTGEMFSHWIKRYIEYCGLLENVDFQIIEFDYLGNVIDNFSKSENQQVSKREFLLSLDSAKHISMVQRNDKGEQARKYFIECEKALRNPIQTLSRIDLARLVIESEEENQCLQIELKENAPLVVFAKALQISEHNILIGELAKILKQNDIEIGQNRLFDWLRDNQYLIRKGEQRNLPTQRSLELGLFEVKTTTINNPDGSVRVTKTTKVTPKGQGYFINKFIKTQNNELQKH